MIILRITVGVHFQQDYQKNIFLTVLKQNHVAFEEQ